MSNITRQVIQNDVQLWFAYDENKSFILINELNGTKEDRKRYFTCPICGEKVIPCMGKKKSWYFKHLKDGCSTESIIHWWVKNKLIERNEEFHIIINGKEEKYICKDIKIEEEYITSHGIYKPDLTVITNNEEIVFFEVYHSNKKKINKYRDIFIELEKTVVEISTKDIVNVENNNFKINTYKSIYYKGKELKDLSKTVKEECNIEKLKGKYNKEQLQKINWLIDDICRYIQKEINIEQLSFEIQSIEDNECRKLICNILKIKRCRFILNDYIDFTKNKYLKIDYIDSVNEPIKIYDRIYGEYEFKIKIFNNTFWYNGNIVNCENDIAKIIKILKRDIKENTKEYTIRQLRNCINNGMSSIIEYNNKHIKNTLINNRIILCTYNTNFILHTCDIDSANRKIKEINDKYYNCNNKYKEKKRKICNSVRDYYDYINIKTTSDTISILDSEGSIIYENYLYYSNINIDEIKNNVKNRVKMLNIYNNYKKYINNINNNLKLVNRNPYIEIDFYKDMIYLYLYIECINRKYEKFNKIILEEVYNDDIGYHNLYNKISDSIRSYIYR